jgi:hypothetical protein
MSKVTGRHEAKEGCRPASSCGRGETRDERGNLDPLGKERERVGFAERYHREVRRSHR